MIVTLVHNGFHGRTHLRFRLVRLVKVRDYPYEGAPCYAALVSPGVARRLNRAVCHTAGYTCYEFVAWEGRLATDRNGHESVEEHADTGLWFVNYYPDGVTPGRYPQR